MSKLNTGLFTATNAREYLEREPQMSLERLSARLWTVSDGLRRSLFVEGDQSVIAFDTFGTPGAARAYRRSIAEVIPGKPVGTIIFSHDHLDHAGFAADLAPEAEIVADELCARVIGLRQASGQTAPTRLLTGTRNEIEIDGVGLTLLNPGPTHGSGNLSAWFADEGLLFSSDTILPNARYGLLPDYHIANFVHFMRGFLEFEWDRFVPGRFEVCDRARFEHSCDFLEAVQQAAQSAFAEFVPIWVMDAMQDYVGARLEERFGDLDGFQQHIGPVALRMVHHYLMGGWGLEDTPGQRSTNLGNELK